jgi:hypothetical protein
MSARPTGLNRGAFPTRTLADSGVVRRDHVVEQLGVKKK